MPSVIVNWSGRCADRGTREELSRELMPIAELLSGYFTDPVPVRIYDQEIEGRILVNELLFDEASERRGAGEIVQIHSNGELDHETQKALDEFFGCTTDPKENIRKYFVIEKARLHGVEFRFYDPRGTGSDERISFVFLESKECGELNGRIVCVEDRTECGKYENSVINTSDWYLKVPHLSLRYFCETWMDRFMGWVKYFHLPELTYWRYETLPGYGYFAQSMDLASKYHRGRKQMGEYMRKRLMDEFREEVRVLNEYIAGGK